MGAVKIDIYNQPLINIANYEDRNMLIKLLTNYKNLEHLAKMGDGVASAILVDLQMAIFKGSLTEIQQYTIIQHFIYKYTTRELGEMLGKHDTTILENIHLGLKKISNDLISGKLYKKDKKLRQKSKWRKKYG